MTNHLPRETCLALDKAGLGQRVEKGEFYYPLGSTCNKNVVSQRLNNPNIKPYVKIPSTDDLIEFVKKKTVERWPGYSVIDLKLSIDIRHNGASAKVSVLDKRVTLIQYRELEWSEHLPDLPHALAALALKLGEEKK